MPSIRSIVALSVALVLAGIAGAIWFSAPEKPAVAVVEAPAASLLQSRKK